MKRRFNKDKFGDNVAPLIVGTVFSIMIAYILLNSAEFFPTLR